MNKNDRITIIVTTSVVQSNPDMHVITTVLKSLSSLIQFNNANLIVVYDGCIQKSSQTHWKSARVSNDESLAYTQFKINTKQAIKSWHSQLVSLQFHFESTSKTINKRNWDADIEVEANERLTFITLSTRFGFAFAVKEALSYVTTPFVLINQHDWLLDCEGLDFSTLTQTIDKSGGLIKYITFTASATKNFLNTCWVNRELPPIHCTADSNLMTTSQCQICLMSKNEKDKESDQNFDRNMTTKQKSTTNRMKNLERNAKNEVDKFVPIRTSPPDIGSLNYSYNDSTGHLFKFNNIEFTRCHFWYDKPHLTTLQTYLDIFDMKMMKRGDFIEDVYGQFMVKCIKERGLKAHEEFGVFLLWEDERRRLEHLNGRKFITEEQKLKVIEQERKPRKQRIRTKRLGYNEECQDERVIDEHCESESLVSLFCEMFND